MGSTGDMTIEVEFIREEREKERVDLRGMRERDREREK